MREESSERLGLLSAKESTTATGKINWAARGKATRAKVSRLFWHTHSHFHLCCYRKVLSMIGWSFPTTIKLTRMLLQVRSGPLPTQVILICGKFTLKPIIKISKGNGITWYGLEELCGLLHQYQGARYPKFALLFSFNNLCLLGAVLSTHEGSLPSFEHFAFFKLHFEIRLLTNRFSDGLLMHP